jgi:beta-lactamase superfamily II metal-dependent hydrolase
MTKAVYAGYPTAKVYRNREVREKDRIGHLLWGTWIEHQEEEDGDWAKVRIRGWDENREKKIGWMKKSDYQDNKVLEVYFIDVAQGDGCLMITPDDKFHLIDAGEEKNMAAYLHWKFNLGSTSGNPIVFKNAIISHPDQDHYRGFSYILDEPRVRFENVFHNGIVERTGHDPLGERVGDFLVDVVTNQAELDALIEDPEKVGGKRYPNLLKKFREKSDNIKMLCSEDEYLPGYGVDDDVKIRVLGPVPSAQSGKRTLKWFGPKGQTGITKNGHSVVLHVEYGRVKILLGGDLNIEAENHLLEHYTGVNPETVHEDQIGSFVTMARKFFQADVAKACHHGSADFTNMFIQSVNAAATVISSGDEEPHSHPRADAVGALGKFGRSNRPLIFCTELARSTRDFIVKAQPTEKELGRTVAVYGNIDVRTDGEKVIIAQRFESTPAHGEWDFYKLERDSDGVLSFVSKHE